MYEVTDEANKICNDDTLNQVEPVVSLKNENIQAIQTDSVNKSGPLKMQSLGAAQIVISTDDPFADLF